MNTSFSLQTIVSKIRSSGRIGFADVQRLQRDVLADGIASRSDAELLIRLDGSLRRRDPAWEVFLTAAVVDCVVWAERPTGTVDEETARWLQALLNEATPRTARRIAREIAEEAQAFENEALAVLAAIGAARSPARRRRTEEAASHLAAPTSAGVAPCQPAV